MRRLFMTALACVPLLAMSQSTCIYSSERVSGLNKICNYRCATGDKSITIKVTEVCPRSL